MKTVAKENLLQIKELLLSITKNQYNAKPEVLSGATIGQHIRHILEFYLLLISGSLKEKISYDNRERNLELEINPEKALDTIEKLIPDINQIVENNHILFKADFTISGVEENIIKSSVARELAYCIEHSIHHQAIIKAGLIALGLQHLTNKYFGIAYSTIRYRNNSCAQ